MKKRNSANVFILGIGTGLGHAIEYVRPCHSIPHAMTSEISQTSCPVKNVFDFIFQQSLKEYLKLNPKDNVTFERILSSNNLPFIYLFMQKIG